MKNRIFILFVCVIGLQNADAQVETQKELDSLKIVVSDINKNLGWLKNLKVGGWIQAQYQYIETKGAKNFDGGDFPANSNNRFMIRRGRVKFTYTNKYSEYVFQLNATERGVNIADIYGRFILPKAPAFSVTAGVMNRPFGFEIEQSSSVRETPERSRFNQTLMPNERDMGAKIQFIPVKGKKLYGFRIDGGFYNGQGIAVPGTTPSFAWTTDYDSFKDFIGKMRYDRSTKNDKINYGLGVSHYNGGFLYQNNAIYNNIVSDSLGIKSWQIADSTRGPAYSKHKAPRIYYGVDAQISIKSTLGTTSIRGEYLAGTQSGSLTSSRSPSTLLPVTYVRNFNAGYAYFIQRIGQTKHELAFKFEWYDPNTKISGKDLTGTNGMTDAELKYTMIGIGYNYYAHENVKFMFHYNMVTNESANGLTGFTKDIRDNVLTLRMQYKF